MSALSSLVALPRALWVLFAATLVNRAGWMVLPFLTLYLTRSLGRTAGEATIVLAVAGLAGLATSPVAGALSDRHGARPVMVASLFLSAAVLCAFPLARTYPSLLAAAALLAFAHELFRPANLAFVSEVAAEDQRRTAFAAVRLATSLGMSIGPAVGGLLAARSFPLLFLADGLTALAAGVVLLLGLPAAAAPAPIAPAAARSLLAALADRRPVLFLAPVLLVWLVLSQHFSTLSLYMVRDLGLSERTYGLTFTINTLLVIAFQVPLTTATAAWPHRRSLVLGAILCGVGFGATWLFHTGPSVLGTVAVWTFGEMILLPTMAAHVADLAAPERRGATMGLYSMTINLAFAAGPWLGGLVLTGLGGGALWGGCLLLCAAAAAMMVRVEGARG